MYSEYDPEAIHYSAYHYDWPLRRDDLAIDLQDRIKQKILNSKYKQLELVDSMIKVAHIEAMQAFQAYIKHPSDKNIPKTFRITSIKDLSTAIDMMSQIIGQDNMKKLEIIKKETEEEESAPSRRARSTPELTEKSAKELISSLNKVHDNEKT